MSRWRFVRGWLWPKFYRKFNWELVVCLDEVLKSMSLIHVKIAHHSRYGCSSVFFRNLIARRLHHECSSNRAISLNANSLLEHWCYSGKIYLRFWQGLHFSSTWNTPLFVMLIILGFHFMLDSFLYCIYEWPSWKNHHTHFVILHICYDEFSSFALCFFFFQVEFSRKSYVFVLIFHIVNSRFFATNWYQSKTWYSVYGKIWNLIFCF